MTEPTDKQLEAFAIEEQFLLFCDVDEFTQIARAVLAKWGNPVPVGVEPVAEVESAVRRAGGFHARLAAGAAMPSVGTKLYTTPQPTQPQAGVVPLTDEQIEALPLWKRFVGLWPETRREIVRTIERHHGIKGGQHGTE